MTILRFSAFIRWMSATVTFAKVRYLLLAIA
jgi:hypothetical protein